MGKMSMASQSLLDLKPVVAPDADWSGVGDDDDVDWLVHGAAEGNLHLA